MIDDLKNNGELIHYNWMPRVANWGLDLDDQFYINAGVKPPFKSQNLEPEKICANDVVFVKTDFLKSGEFQDQYLPRIKQPFSLISGISSYSVDRYQEMLNNSYLQKWFCTNPPVQHPKIIGIPIGFEEMDRLGGNQLVLKQARSQRIPVQKRSNKILLPYHTLNTNSRRKKLVKSLAKLPFVDAQINPLPFERYLELIGRYQYCIALDGSGIDTHRNYECLLMDVIPITISSTIENIFQDWQLPGIFIESWDKINRSFYDNLIGRSHQHSFDRVDEFLLIKNHISKILSE